jgi:hypothetical protein
MYKKTITYKDYDGRERSEDHYFNLDEGEIMEMEMSVSGGYSNMIERVANEQSEPELFKIFKEFVLATYGEKTSDGKYFMKEDENGRPLVRKFLQSRAYSALMMEFMTKTNAFTEFVNKVIPAEMAEKYGNAAAAKSAPSAEN